jgi:glycosyltransferase involved in cell wall biosynthesis
MHLHRRTGVYPGLVDRIIAPSAFMADLLQEFGLDGRKITHVPHPIDAKRWTPRYSGDYALFVGRLSREKGVDTLIRAAALAPKVPVRIVGTGPEDVRLHRLAESLGADNVTFVGFRHGEELKAEYERARFVVIPSVWYEVFGLVALEAYASGKPVVASRLGGLSELVREGETGLGVNPGDPKELAEALRALWNDEGRCDRLGQAARRWVERDFRPSDHYERIMEVYREAGR